MPITDEGRIEYQMPEEIKNQFRKEFMSDFHKKVIQTFKQNDIRQGRVPSEYEKFTYYDWWLYMEGTGGWYKSLKDTCDKHNLQNVIAYYDQLPWYDSDLFDSELGDLLVEYGLVEEGEPDSGFGMMKMKSDKVIIVYHKQTDTYWTNDLNWKERHKVESIYWGSVEIKSNNIFEVKRIMNEDGFELVKKENLPSWAK